METMKSVHPHPLTFNLREIADWQLNNSSNKVDLPPLQRGFVWKAHQIETLWDSILRGFPIGSLLLSKSEDQKLFLLDGQQRATSIAIGFYDPWQLKNSGNSAFWSLKNIPVSWIDLAPPPESITDSQKFVIRIVTQSHPWGYQRVHNNKPLSVPEKSNALDIFRKNPKHNDLKYIQFSQLEVFPFAADLPVPLSFLIKSISDNSTNWKENLIALCKNNLPVDYIKTYNGNNYIDSLEKKLSNHEDEYISAIFSAIKNIDQLHIPGIVVESEILKEIDSKDDDPTLFVRLNSSGTKIAGEELVYSIYKASFPEAKDLIENIGANFVAPSLVISLISRLALSEINNQYPTQISVNDFRKKIKDIEFKNKLKELIGDKNNSPASTLFNDAFNILLSKQEYSIPPILVKNLVKGAPDLFLMLLKWLKVNNKDTHKLQSKNVIATLTTLSWFGNDNQRFVKEIWNEISTNKLWTKEVLNIPYVNKNNSIMYPMIKPSTLREYLIQSVILEKITWDNLYPDANSQIIKSYKSILDLKNMEQEVDVLNATNKMWDNFMNKLFKCKSLILFAQRNYINENFGEFNQMENLEDTNTPWDWDHIYPISWVYNKSYINPNTKHWTNSIGNFRAISLEENRSEGNKETPYNRLMSVRNESFIKDNDWEYWKKINGRINEGNSEMINAHLYAIINRLCNIYEEWYKTFDIGGIFSFENEDLSNTTHQTSN